MAIDAKKLLKLRLRHAFFISTLIIWQPFVRAVVLNGSLAQGKTKPESDIDLLIIARSGRIFTARFFTTFIVWLTGLKRGSGREADSRGKICLNYFLTEGFLIVPHHRGEEMNRYCAENYSASILLAGDKSVFDKFMAMNSRWMDKYIKNQKSKIKMTIQNSKFPQQFNNGTMKLWIERCLSGRLGQNLENRLKKLQLRRIYRDPRAKAFPDLIYADDREMRFHPPKGS